MIFAGHLLGSTLAGKVQNSNWLVGSIPRKHASHKNKGGQTPCPDALEDRFYCTDFTAGVVVTRTSTADNDTIGSRSSEINTLGADGGIRALGN